MHLVGNVAKPIKSPEFGDSLFAFDVLEGTDTSVIYIYTAKTTTDSIDSTPEHGEDRRTVVFGSCGQKHQSVILLVVPESSLAPLSVQVLR